HRYAAVPGFARYRVDGGVARGLGGYRTVRFPPGRIASLLLPSTMVHVRWPWPFGTLWALCKAQLYRVHRKAGGMGLCLAVPVVGGRDAGHTLPPTLP